MIVKEEEEEKGKKQVFMIQDQEILSDSASASARRGRAVWGHRRRFESS